MEDIDKLVKLKDSWTFQIKLNNVDFSKDQKKDSWMNGYKNILTDIDDVPKFWGLWNNVLGNIQDKNKTIPYTIHAFFKNKIEPAWEDKSNVGGCSMHFYISNTISNKKSGILGDNDKNVNLFAESVALLCISNIIDGINGSTFDVKPPRGRFGSKWKISIWLDNRRKETIDSVKKYLLSETNLEEKLINECRIDNHS